MKDLEKEYCYDTIDLSENKKGMFLSWLIRNDIDWDGLDPNNLRRFVYYSISYGEFLHNNHNGSGLIIKNALELFETDIEELHAEHKESSLKDINEVAKDICEYAIGLIKEKGLKESENKLNFELDFDFIEGMARRIESETKYPAYNWQKPLDKNKLISALMRHSVNVKKGNFEDNGDEYGHLLAVACNAMFIYYQLKNN